MSVAGPAACLLVAALGSSAAWAETHDASADFAALPVVTVTGHGDGLKAERPALSKLPDDLHDAPQSITVLNRELMQSQGATSLADALRNVPGITLGAAEGGQIGANINLNGFSARTDIYLDGFRDRGQYYRDVFALQQVEVLMGPSSMLFGRGSTGGAVNQVTKTPTLKARSEFTAAETTNGLTRLTGDVNAPLSDHAAARVALMGQSGAISTRRETRVEDFGVAPSVAFGLGQPTTLTLSAFLQHNRDRPDYGVPPLNGRPARVDRDTVYGFADDRTIQDVGVVSAEVAHRAGDRLDLRNRVQFNQVDTDARETAANGVGTVGASGYTAAPGAASTAPLGALSVRLQSHDRVIRDTSLFDQVEAKGEVKTGAVGHAFLAGAEVGQDRYRNQNYYRNGTCNGVALNPASGTSGYVACEALVNPPFVNSPASAPRKTGNLATGSADTVGLYLSDTASLTESLKLVGGVRYDRYDATISNSINSTNTAGSTVLASAHQRVNFTSVRVGAIWRPVAEQTYYVSYSTSFNPSLEQLTSTTGLSKPLPPETNAAYEAGARFDLLRDGLSLTGALFQITKDNARSQNADNTYTADGRIRVNGARLGLEGRPLKTVQVFAGYAHLDAKITEGIAVGTNGKVPANTPKDSASIWTLWRAADHWEVGGGAVYSSARFANNTDLTRVPSYTRWDAALTYRAKRFDVRLNLFNLFDARYYDALIPSDGGRAVPGIGRTAMLSLTVRP